MNQTVKFFPLCRKCKQPFGGVKVNETVNLRLRLSRPSNPDYVYVVLTKDGENPVSYEMERGITDEQGFTEFTVSLKITTKGLYLYHFEVDTPDKNYYIGCDETLNAMLGKGSEWQLTVYEEVRPAPSWNKGGVFYQIMPDRFNIGGERLKTKNNAVYRDDLYGIPEFKPDKNGKILNNDFFGGNLQGITKKLGYLKSLGVTAVYLNPIFEAKSNHKYDTASYMRIDGDFGSEDDLKRLIKRAGKNGIKIILDGVFSHTGDDSVYFNKYGTYSSVGAYQSQDSAYSGWYNFSEFPDKYESWWGIDTLPNTSEDNPGFTEFITGEDGVLRKWTALGLGGWRLDVADELPDKFLDRAASAIKAQDSGAMVLGEVWEDASNKVSYSRRRRYLNGGQLDSVTNYPFKDGIINFVKTGDAKKLLNAVHSIINNYPKNVLDNLMNMLGTHDTVRILTELGDSGKTETRAQRAKAKLINREAAVKRLKLATVLQYTLPGVPVIYYGDEAGLEGFEDPFNRRFYPWENQDKKLLSWYRALGKIRAENKAVFADGRFKSVTAEDGIFIFERRSKGETIYIAVNNSDENYKMPFNEEYTDILNKKAYNGVVPAGAAVILKRSACVL